ncbi:MAG: hypothetical protein R3F05_13635 [Planctomycetota bacterium]
MTATHDVTQALTTAAFDMLTQAHDEAIDIAMLLEDAVEVLRDEASIDGTLGALEAFARCLAGLTRSVEATQSLLLRARGRGGR